MLEHSMPLIPSALKKHMKMYAFSMFLRGFHCVAMKFSEGKLIPKYIQMHTFVYILGMRLLLCL